MSWYLEALKKYAVFSGRARRREYWFFTLFHAIALLVLFTVDAAMGTADSGIGWLSGLYLVATLIPSLAVTVRRLHDTDRSAWWLLIGMVPFLGVVVLLVFYVQDGTPGSNRYGESPKATPALPA